ncbi:hypothetical protein [Micromonospora deserti]|nr:hypothetical protein [Micromonospora deserti]
MTDAAVLSLADLRRGLNVLWTWLNPGMERSWTSTPTPTTGPSARR